MLLQAVVPGLEHSDDFLCVLVTQNHNVHLDFMTWRAVALREEVKRRAGHAPGGSSVPSALKDSTTCPLPQVPFLFSSFISHAFSLSVTHSLPEHSSIHSLPLPNANVMLLIIIIYFSLLQLSCFIPLSQ